MVPKNSLLRRFSAELASEIISSASAHEWQAQLEQYLRTLPDVPGDVPNGTAPKSPMLTFEELVYFWGNIGAAVPDDAQFCMLLWRSCAMHRVRPAGATNAAPDISHVDPHQKPSLHGGNSAGKGVSGGRPERRLLL
jgi:hypothetical protein